MSKAGLAILFDRAGGSLTEQMRDEVAAVELRSSHAQNLIQEVREMWDTWDVRDKVQGDDMLEYDSFYNGFMAPYFSCYRCNDSKKAIQALDMDSDGQIDWNEFLVYLKWAMRQYPNIENSQDLLDITFRKGLIPAMRDEMIKQQKK